MDLIDLYHAHEQQIASPDTDDDEAFVHKLNGEQPRTRKDSTKLKKPRFVPWEPFRAAPSADRKGEAPNGIPRLIPYGSALDENSNHQCTTIDEQLVDTRRNRVRQDSKRSETELLLEKQLAEMKRELDIERKLNAELKKLLVATISDELQGQVEALTEDKIRLAHRVEEYSERLIHEDEQVDQLLIDRDVWKCKFLAQSIRTDELNIRSEFLLGMLRDAQRIVREMCVPVNSIFRPSNAIHTTTPAIKSSRLQRDQINCQVFMGKQSVRETTRSLDKKIDKRAEVPCNLLNYTENSSPDHLTLRHKESDGASNSNKEARYFANLDLVTYFTRSPCEERVQRKAPKYENVTISCCRKCSGREIHLL